MQGIFEQCRQARLVKKREAEERTARYQKERGLPVMDASQKAEAAVDPMSPLDPYPTSPFCKLSIKQIVTSTS
jgi:hypothetical protein